jgi:hypothetical protein
MTLRRLAVWDGLAAVLFTGLLVWGRNAWRTP